MNTPEAVIASYLDHVQDEAYVDAALKHHSPAALVDAAVRLVQGTETEGFDDAALFIRHVSTGLFRQETTLAFREHLPGSGLFDALDRCLRAPSFHLRTQAANTFGKLCYPENADRLIRVLEERRDIDPLLTPQLLFEIRWLRHDNDAHWRRIQWLTQAPEGICRWAALQAIEDTAPYPPASPVDGLLAKLQHDSFDYVRAEAGSLRRELHHQADMDSYPVPSGSEKEPSANAAPAPAAAHPSMKFSDLSIRFWHHHTAADYTTADVLTFLKKQEASAHRHPD